MFEEIIIKYFHPGYQLGMQDIRNVWLLAEKPVRLKTSIHRGNLVFRFPGTGKRISYRTLKQGIVKKTIILKQRIEWLTF